MWDYGPGDLEPMFQIEPTLWLQGYQSTAMTWLMAGITLLGYTPVEIGFVIILAFGFRLRPGLGILLALLLCGVVTESLKSAFALPRPSDVDPRVIQPIESPLIAAFGSQTYGFPSGHVSSAAALLVSAALCFRSRWLVIAAIIWPLLMGLSRMYLGRHFLADVLGGLMVGLLAAGSAALLFRGLDQPTGTSRGIRPLLPLIAVAVLLVILTPFAPVISPVHVGRLAGLTVSVIVLRFLGFPSDQGTMPQRWGRVVIAALVFLGSWIALSAFVDATRVETVASAAVIMAATLFGGVTIARWLGWYAPPMV